MEIALRAALISWLAADPALSARLNAVVEEAPSRTALPWLAVVASASADWSAKEASGREVRIAFELQCRGDRPGDAAELVAAIEERIASLPGEQDGWQLVTSQFLRARAEARGANTRAILIEYRFRLIAS